MYSAGESEEIVGKALAGGRRDDVILATKFHASMGEDANERGNSRRWIVREVDNSLRRLQTDWIDLYQVHRPDRDTDVEETLSALTDLQRAGKIHAFGCSTFPAESIVEAHWTSKQRSLARFATEQPPYSILVRSVERDVLPVAERYGMGVIPWSPLAGGWLTGRYRQNQEAPQSSRAQRIPAVYDLSLPGNQAKLEAAEQLAQLAEEAGLTMVHLALAFVLAHPAVTARSSDRERWSSSRPSSAPPTCCSGPTSWIASTRSCPPAPLWRSWTVGTCRRGSPTLRCADAARERAAGSSLARGPRARARPGREHLGPRPGTGGASRRAPPVGAVGRPRR